MLFSLLMFNSFEDVLVFFYNLLRLKTFCFDIFRVAVSVKNISGIIFQPTQLNNDIILMY